MRWIIFVIALGGGILSCGSSDETDAPSTRQCEQLRDHLVELRLEGTTIDAAKHRAALRGALGEDFVAKCTAGLTRDQVRCGLGAKDSATALDCNADRSAPLATSTKGEE